MIETKFKTLVHSGMYVDVMLLRKGIYGCVKPYLYGLDQTIERMVKQNRDLQAFLGDDDLPECYYDNLKACKMVALTISIDEDI